MRSVAGLAALCALLLFARTGHADPQWNAGIVTGVCGRGADGHLWQDTCWFNGVTADVLFGRNRDADFALGPYVDFSTAGFDDSRPGGGLSALVPWHPIFPLVLSVGGYGRHSDAGWEPGVASQLFVGSRSYNFHSSYGITAGLVVDYQHGLGDTRENLIVIGLRIDGLAVALPFIAGYSLIRGAPEDD